MKKIPINKVADEVFQKKGFDKKGCYGCSCDDECCKFGADIDKESYDLIFHNREIIEKELGIDLDESFDETDTSVNSDYLGGGHHRSITRPDGFCVFHNIGTKGCLLYKLAIEKKLSKRIIPTICRVYPLTWNDERLHIEEWIPDACNCLEIDNDASHLFDTQKHEIDDIFEISDSAKK